MSEDLEIKNKELSKVTHQGKWKIDKDIEIDCYVTNDRLRLLSLRGTARAMNLKGGGSGGLLRNLKSKWIQPYLTDQLKDWILGAETDTIDKIQGVKGPSFVPFEASLFVDLCKAYVKARNDGILSDGQKEIADRLLGIMSAFAKVGIVAIVDEITGFQEERAKDELQQILSKYISQEYLEWTKRFPDEFYIQLFRLRNWGRFKEAGQKMPGVVGKYTNQLVYEQLPNGVLEELKNRTPKTQGGHNSVKFHQSLSLDTGVKHLDKHLVAVITLMKVSDTWEDFIYLFNKSYSKNVQLRIDFKD
ncbi:P63C domain-containing protein [Aliarcobacter butzleri]